MQNALWLLLVLILGGCAQSVPSSSSRSLSKSLESSNGPAEYQVGGTIGTEGGGNMHTWSENFWYELEALTACVANIARSEHKGRKALEQELYIFASNLEELSLRKYDVIVRDQPELLDISEVDGGDIMHRTVYVNPVFYTSPDLLRRNMALIKFANQYGRIRLEWNANYVGWVAYQCSPGTNL